MGLRDPLPATEVTSRLSQLEGWEKDPDREEIHKTFRVEYYTAVQAIIWRPTSPTSSMPWRRGSRPARPGS